MFITIDLKKIKFEIRSVTLSEESQGNSALKAFRKFNSYFVINICYVYIHFACEISHRCCNNKND